MNKYQKQIHKCLKQRICCVTDRAQAHCKIRNDFCDESYCPLLQKDI